MKTIGLLMFLLGFVWLVWQVCVSFTEYQYVRSIWQTQHLPAGEFIPRSDAASALRDLSIDLKDNQRHVLFPAAVMLVGGLVSTFVPRRATRATIVT
jgi:hypothetical protein